MKSRTIVSIGAVLGVLALGAVVGSAQQPAAQNQNAAQNMTDLQSTMSNMMSMQHSMMSTTNRADAQLNELLAKVEAARGNRRTDAMVELLKALVADQQQVHRQQMQMQGQMMSGMNMMSHMMGQGASHMMGGMMGGMGGGPTP
jgi:hypothetical protein